MKTKLVYVLVSSEKDLYLEQAYISMLSAKHHMPDVNIVLLVDSLTKKSFTGIREKEAAVADEIIAVELDASCSAQKRSRLLKTNVREFVKGDFLFIDCDTIVVKPLDEIDSFNADIAACWDSHALLEHNPYKQMCLEHGRLLDWPIEKEKEYFNSGIIFVRDNESTHNFYKRWNENYLNGYPKGVRMDQPSLAKTNYEHDHFIKTLPDIWNCEFRYGMRYLKDAKIVHYLCTNINIGGAAPFLLNSRVPFMEIKNNGMVPEEVIALFDDPFLGIAKSSCLLAGDDVPFAATTFFLKVRNMYLKKSLGYRFLSKFFNFMHFVKLKIKGK